MFSSKVPKCGGQLCTEWMSGLEDKGMSVGLARFGGYVFS